MNSVPIMSMVPPRRQCLALVVMLALTLPLVLVPVQANAATSGLLGVYYGNQGWKMDQVRAMERWQGKKNATVLLFTNFCDRAMNNLFSQQLPNIWNNGNVPVITWEPYHCTASATPTDIEVRIAKGGYDTYIRTWADRLKGWLSGPDGVYGNTDDRRAYVRLAHEMNGDWYPWSAAVGSNSPADYQQMWHTVRAKFTGVDGSHLQWVWTVNHVDVGGYAAEAYYPGHDEVDWVAIDGYNWGTSQSWSTWQTPQYVFDNMLGRLRSLASAKPLAITEGASSTTTTSGINSTGKSQWIADMFTYANTQNVRMLVWFNEDKETDWAIFGGSNGDGTYVDGRTRYKVFSAYQTAVSNSNFVGSTHGAPRLLTDAQFAGQ